MSMTRTILVTGASGGLGSAIAHQLLALGYDVVVTGRNTARLQAIADAYEPHRVTVLTFDVADAGAIAPALAPLHAAGRKLYGLVNAAGVSGRAELSDPQAPEVWERVMRTNLDGTFHVTRAALGLLSDGARVVNLSSDLGKMGMAAYAAYCASKHGVIGLTRALALEFAPRGITVNAVCPGWVETAMAEQGFSELAEAVNVGIEDIREGERLAVPLGRFATPSEVAALVAYLLSDGAAIMTGQAIDLSGGSVMA